MTLAVPLLLERASPPRLVRARTMKSNLALIQRSPAPRIRGIMSVLRKWRRSRPPTKLTASPASGSCSRRMARPVWPSRITTGTSLRFAHVAFWTRGSSLSATPISTTRARLPRSSDPCRGRSVVIHRGNVRARDVFASAGANSQTSQFLTREQEVHLFRKMNFLKYQAAQLRASINPSRAHSADLDRVEELLGEACAIRDTIVCSYLALVVSIVLKWTGRLPRLPGRGLRGERLFDTGIGGIRLHASAASHFLDPGHHQRLCPASFQRSPATRPVRHRPRGAVEVPHRFP